MARSVVRFAIMMTRAGGVTGFCRGFSLDLCGVIVTGKNTANFDITLRCIIFPDDFIHLNAQLALYRGPGT